jgi:signal transduction histidine kinase
MQQTKRQHMLSLLATFIFNHRSEITNRWVEAIRRNPDIEASDNLTYRQLVDHMPTLFEEMCELLRQEEDRQVKADIQRTAKVHGRCRWKDGYKIDELLRELSLIRKIILTEYIPAFAKQNPDFTAEIKHAAKEIIHEFINDVIISSTRQFSEDCEAVVRRYAEKLEKANEQLMETNRRLNFTNESRLRFTSIVSHELRNMLDPMTTGTHLLNKGGDEQTEQKLLDMLERNMSDMKALLNEVLDYSVVINGHEGLKVESFELHSLFSELINTFQSQAEAKGLVFETEIDPALRIIVSDRLKIKRIANNLITNAIKYTEKGGVYLAGHKIDQDHFAITVRDTGPGIAPDRFAHLFEEFYRAAPSSNVRGTGLGLAISKRLAELLGGQIAVDSEVGQGSRFEVTLRIRS